LFDVSTSRRRPSADRRRVVEASVVVEAVGESSGRQFGGRALTSFGFPLGDRVVDRLVEQLRGGGAVLALQRLARGVDPAGEAGERVVEVLQVRVGLLALLEVLLLQQRADLAVLLEPLAVRDAARAEERGLVVTGLRERELRSGS
jgi:hypothetical protein